MKKLLHLNFSTKLAKVWLLLLAISFSVGSAATASNFSITRKNFGKNKYAFKIQRSFQSAAARISDVSFYDVEAANVGILKMPTSTDALTDQDIQALIDNAAPGDEVKIPGGIYTINAPIVVNKGLHLTTNEYSGAYPNALDLDEDGYEDVLLSMNASIGQAITVQAQDVRISYLKFEITTSDRDAVASAISTLGNCNGLSIAENQFFLSRGIGFTENYVFGIYGLKLDNSSEIDAYQANVRNNLFSPKDEQAPLLFGKAVYADGLDLEVIGNRIVAVYGLQCKNSGLSLINNSIDYGTASLINTHGRINYNQFGYDDDGDNPIGGRQLEQANLIPAQLEVRGSLSSTGVSIAHNRFVQYSKSAIVVQRSNAISIHNNVFLPHQDAENFESIIYTTKEATSGAQAPIGFKGFEVYENVFYGAAANKGTALAFYNHNAHADTIPLREAKFGNNKLDNAHLYHVRLDDAKLNGIPITTSANLSEIYGVAQDQINTTNVLPYNGNVMGYSYKYFDKDFSERVTLQTYEDLESVDQSDQVDDIFSERGKIYDNDEDQNLGHVSMNPWESNLAIVNLATPGALQRMLNIADDGILIWLWNGEVEDATIDIDEDIIVRKAHKLQGDVESIKLSFRSLEVDIPQIYGDKTEPFRLIGFHNEEYITVKNTAKFKNGGFRVENTQGGTNVGLQIDGTIEVSPNASVYFYFDQVYFANVTAGQTLTIPGNKGNGHLQLFDVAGTGVAQFYINVMNYISLVKQTTFNQFENPLVNISLPIGTVGEDDYLDSKTWSVYQDKDNYTETFSAKIRAFIFDEIATAKSINSDLTNLSKVKFAKFVGPELGDEGSFILGSDASYATQPGYVTLSSTESFSDFLFFTLGITESALPVSLANFTATATTNGALVKWSTKSETGSGVFEVEKSENGVDFAKLTTVAMKGVASNYQFVDRNFSKSSYYRLVQIDANGAKKIYDNLAKFVKFSSANADINIYPNPVVKTLYINLNTSAAVAVKVSVVALTGKVVKSYSGNASVVALAVADLTAGNYIVQITTASGNVSRKIVKL